MNPLIDMEFVVLLAIGFAALVAVAAWPARRDERSAGRWLLPVLRFLGTLAVLLLLLNPGNWKEPVEAGTSGWAVMLDTSASMDTGDGDPVGGHRTRWEVVRQAVNDLEEKLAHPELMQGYGFAESLESLDRKARDARSADGSATRLVASGLELLNREQSRGRRLTGIVLLSDGRDPLETPPDAFALRAAARGVPVYPVVVGSVVREADLSLQVASRRMVGFLAQPVTVQGLLRNDGMGPVQATVTLQDGTRRPVDQQVLMVGNDQSTPFRFEVRPEQAGYIEYSLAVEPREGEANPANNRISVGVVVLKEPLQVLLLEGEPYWDTKFLSHLLRGQANMSVTAMFRVAENRYFTVSSHRGLAATTQDLFPATDEAMARYDLVIIGRGSEYMVDESRAVRLRRFVHERGGCLVFARGKSYNGPTSWLEPLEPVAWGSPVGSAFHLVPLFAGEQVGLFGGLLPGREDPAWGALPALERAHAVAGLKGFASVLAEGSSGSGNERFPLLLSRRYGRGLVLMINGDGLWKWGFAPPASAEDVLYRNLWIRLFQWAVSFSEFNPGANYAVQTDRALVRRGESVRIRVGCRADQPTNAPSIGVYRGATLHQRLTLATDEGRPNQWVGMALFDEPDSYRLAVETPDGKALDAQTTVQVLPPPGERDERSADPASLERLARLSGGRVIGLEELAEVARTLEQPVVAGRRGTMDWDPAWDDPRVALAILALLAVEWYLRRRMGLL